MEHVHTQILFDGDGKKETKMKVQHNDVLAYMVDPQKVAEQYNSVYVGEFTVMDAKGWCNTPFQIFYSDIKHPEGSNYMGFYYNPIKEGFFVVNGISAVRDTKTNKPVIYTGIEREGIVIYSAFRHDYQSNGNGHFADGGRDYTRAQLGDTQISFKIVKDKLILVNKK